jgi:hypothetical protein
MKIQSCTKWTSKGCTGCIHINNCQVVDNARLCARLQKRIVDGQDQIKSIISGSYKVQ